MKRLAHGNPEEIIQENLKLRAELAIAVEALEFYASDACWGVHARASFDCSGDAKQALARIALKPVAVVEVGCNEYHHPGQRGRWIADENDKEKSYRSKGTLIVYPKG